MLPIQLTRYAWLSIFTALFTIGLKMSAYLLTRSVGLLSDALESTVNLVAAIFVLIVLKIAAHPPDAEHAYGHTKAEYFSTGVEGTLIVIAALTIAISAIRRFFAPQPLQQLDLGLLISLVATACNFVVARILLQAGRTYRSITLQADAQHLLTDVWTSIGVLIGIGLVALTEWQLLDPLIAILVAGQIIYAGFRLVRQATLGLMDTALPPEEQQKIVTVLNQHATNGVQFHALRTRQSGAHAFVSVHIQVPGHWTVQSGHSLLEQIEQEIRQALPSVSIFTHLEPAEDPVSWQDIELYRQ